MSTRTDLAAACNARPKIKAHPFVTGDTEPGTVFVRLERIDYPNPFGGIAHWNVVLVLPQDQADAEKYLGQELPGLLAALEPHLAVTSVVPQQLDITGVGYLPCAFINGHREAD